MSYLKDMQIIENNIYFDLDFSDIIKTKYNFNCLVDCLQKDNCISEKTSQNICLSMNKKNKTVYICCGSYRKRIGA